MPKPILCLDFDGVCHQYRTAWQGATVISDPEVPGLFEFLIRAAPHFDIQISSARSTQDGGIEAMQKWFIDQFNRWMREGEREIGAMPAVSFPKEKPQAHVTLDDRGLTFNGQWPDIEILRNFRPWNR